MKSKLIRTSAGFAAGILLATNAGAALVDLGPGSFTAQASVIDFSEWGLGTVNPSITVSTASLGSVTVSTAGSFVGQTVTGGSVRTITCSPTAGPLTLNTASGAATVYTANDGAAGATSPTLSGDPIYNGPISVLFSTPVAAVGLKGGYFDALGATTIQAFDTKGNSLGSIVNSVLGFEFYGLADSTGAADISGISFYITGNEPYGFEIDNLTFGAASEVTGGVLPGVPDTGSTIALLLCSVLGLALVQRRVRVALC